MEYKRICANEKCKKVFVTTRANKKACCAACSEEMNKVRNRKTAKEQYLRRKMTGLKIRCRNCGKDFIGAGNQIYCSNTCRIESLKKNKNHIKCCCEICGTDFMTEYRTNFCSETCKEIGRNLGMNVEPARRRKNKKRDPLSEYALKARQAGMSYGQYVGQEYIEQQRSEGKY